MMIGGTTKSGLSSTGTLVHEREWARPQETGGWLIEASNVALVASVTGDLDGGTIQAASLLSAVGR
jgi:hypothetical protein